MNVCRADSHCTAVMFPVCSLRASASPRLLPALFGAALAKRLTFQIISPDTDTDDLKLWQTVGNRWNQKNWMMKKEAVAFNVWAVCVRLDICWYCSLLKTRLCFSCYRRHWCRTDDILHPCDQMSWAEDLKMLWTVLCSSRKHLAGQFKVKVLTLFWCCDRPLRAEESKQEFIFLNFYWGLNIGHFDQWSFGCCLTSECWLWNRHLL